MLVSLPQRETYPDSFEPSDEGLIVTTSKETGDGSFHQGKIFLWYVGRPRRLFYDSRGLHHPVLHNDHIVLLTGPDSLDGISSRDQGVADVMDRKILLNDRIDRIVSHEGKLLGVRERKGNIEGVHFANGYWSVSDIGEIGDHSYNPIGLCPSTVLGLVSSGDLYSIGAYDGSREWVYPLYEGSTNPDSWVHVILKAGKLNQPKSIQTRNGNTLVGKVAALDEIDHLGETTEIVINERVRNTYRNVIGLYEKYEKCSDPTDYKELDVQRASAIEEAFKVVEDLGIRKPDMDWLGSYGYVFDKKFSVRHTAVYNSHLLYAMGNQLYSLGREEPLWTFRDTVTGLLAVPEDIVKFAKGYASVKIGNSNAVGTSLRLAA